MLTKTISKQGKGVDKITLIKKVILYLSIHLPILHLASRYVSLLSYPLSVIYTRIIIPDIHSRLPDTK